MSCPLGRSPLSPETSGVVLCTVLLPVPKGAVDYRVLVLESEAGVLAWMLHLRGNEMQVPIASAGGKDRASQRSSPGLQKGAGKREATEGWDSPGHREMSGCLATQLSLCLLVFFLLHDF